MESNAYPFTPKTYPNDLVSTIDISRLLFARNGQVSASVDCLDDPNLLCKAREVHSFSAMFRVVNEEGDMTTFDKREEGFEKKFAHDEELRFKANARRNKMLGLWAAEKMGLSGPAADAYAKEVVVADFEEAGDDDVLRKVSKDFNAKGVAQSDQQIRQTMDALMAAGGRADQGRHLSAAPAAAARRQRFDYPHGFKLMANLPGYSLARRLAAGETVYTGWCALPAPIIVETIAREGFVAVTIDQQHGLWDTAATAVAIAAIRAAGSAPVVRVPLGAFATASRSLDFGAEGIIAPMINTVADAKAFVSAAKFPPLGERSWGPTRAMTLAGISDAKQYLNEANAATVTLAMIETKTAMANLDAIAAVPGIDVLFVGPSDLSIGLTDGKELDPHSRYRRGGARQDRRGLPQGRQDRGPLLRQRRARGRLRQARRPLPRGRQRSRLPARRHRGAAQGAEGLAAQTAASPSSTFATSASTSAIDTSTTR